MNIEKQYDDIGPDYILGQKEYFSKREGQARLFIKKFLVNLKGKRILDVGCGSGEDIIMCESLGGEEIYGIDASHVMTDEAKRQVKHPENIIVGQLEDQHFAETFFDIIISRFALNYLESLDKAYFEIARILKPKGMFIAVFPHPFRDMTLQNDQVYGKREIIKMNLYNNKVEIKFPTHTLSDYLPDLFFDRFDLKGIVEEDAPEEYVKNNNLITPGFLGLAASRR